MDEPGTARRKDDAQRDVPGMGALIGIGAGFGLILGLLFDNLALGLAIGAGLGTVAGAVVECYRARRTRTGKRAIAAFLFPAHAWHAAAPGPRFSGQNRLRIEGREAPGWGWRHSEACECSFWTCEST